MPIRLTLVRALLLTSVAFLFFPRPGWSAPSVITSDEVVSTPESDQRLAKRESPRSVPSTSKPLSSQGMSRGTKPPEELRLNLEGRDIVIIYSTGTVQIGEGLTVDEASRDFWRKVGELAPGFCQERRQTSK